MSEERPCPSNKKQENNVLHIAIKFKQVEFCKEILNYYSSSSSRLLVSNSKGESPLHVAAATGCLEIAQLVLECCCRDVEDGQRKEEVLRMANWEEDTALHVAVRNGDIAIATMLIEADEGLLRMVNKANASPLCLAVEGGFSNIAAFILKKFPQSINGNHININNALCSAIIHSHHDIVKLLLERKPKSSWEEADQIGWTPLHYAALYGDLKSTQLLLQGNSSIAYIADRDGVSALHVAASRGHIKVVELLLQYCPDVHEVTDNKGRTLLHVAVMSGQEKMVWHILGMPRLVGIVNEKDDEGNTALHLAAIHKRVSVIVTLLDRKEGMETAVANNKGFTAYDIFSNQPRKPCFSEAKIDYWLKRTRGLPALQGWVRTNLKKEILNGEVLEIDRDTNMFGDDKKDDVSTATTKQGNGTTNQTRLEIHLLVGTLIATVTFQATFTLPGDYNQDGTNKLREKPAFVAFIWFNSTAFIFSIATVFIQLATSKFSYTLRSRYASLAQLMMVIATLSMLLAFSASMHVELINYPLLRLMAYIFVGSFLSVFFACWFVDPLALQIPGLKRLRKGLRNLLFRCGIINNNMYLVRWYR